MDEFRNFSILTFETEACLVLKKLRPFLRNEMCKKIRVVTFSAEAFAHSIFTAKKDDFFFYLFDNDLWGFQSTLSWMQV